jgi:Ca2+-binding RTX toxin-like protein
MVDTPVVWTGFTQVNTSDGATAQADGQVVALQDGGYIVVWTDSSGVLATNDTVVAQRYNGLGEKIGGETLIHQQNGTETQPSVALLADGSIAVGFVRGNGDVLVRRFDANLDSIGLDTIANGANTLARPSITAFANGSYLITYTLDAGGGDFDILGRVVQANGDGINFDIDTGAGLSDFSAAATLSDGNAVVVYDELDVVKFAIVTPAGTVSVAPTAVPGSNDVNEVAFLADVAALEGGGFVVTWTDAPLTVIGDIRATIFTNTGVALEQNILVNTSTTGDQKEPTVVSLSDGGFLVTWEDGNLNQVRGQRFDSDGNKIGVEYTVKNGLATDSPDSALLSDGRVAYAVGDVSTGDGDVVTAIFDPRSGPVLNGTNASELLTSTPGEASVVNGLGGDDTIFGFDADTLNGGTGNDTLRAGSASTTLIGQSGNDSLFGRIGNDTLIGGAGKDLLVSGSGQDSFDFNNKNETKKGANADVIFDFSTGQDTIDLLGIDAKTTQGGNQKFKFISTQNFHDRAGELRIKIDDDKVFVVVQGDVNGDGRADFEIKVNGVDLLVAGDFVL